MAAQATSPTPAEIARELRDIAERMERGEEVSPETADLAARLAKQEKHARAMAAAERVMSDHASILAALAK